MKLKDIMKAEVARATRAESAVAAWDRMRAAGAEHLVVVQGDEVVGTLSAHDLSGPAGGAHRRMGRTVGDLMHRELVTATPGKTIAWAARAMRKAKIDCLPIVERGKLVGLVSTYEMLGVLARKGAGGA